MGSLVTKKRLIIYLYSAALIFVIIVGTAYWYDMNSAVIPILMYHNVDESGDPGSTVSSEVFESHIKALCDAGYTAISFEELYDYVVSGAPLPEHPVMITFDDGYISVYDAAFPILQKYDMKATAFVIGVFFGESIYKGISYLEITPHFGDAEAREMAESGIFSIQSHSYDMHQFIPYEPGPARLGILRMSGESRSEYVETFYTDFTQAADQIENAVGARPFVYSYPFGRATRPADRALRDMGVNVTLVIVPRANRVVVNMPQSLFGLGRFNVSGDMTPDELIGMIRN